jgi:DNA mismatch repair ATPase MutS
MTRPILHDPNEREPFMNIKDMRHPCVSMTGVNFIPNDIIIGDINNTNDANTN